MSPETLGSQGEQGKVDPVKEARKSINSELFGQGYRGGVLLTRLVELQNALLRSQLKPEKIYHELDIFSSQVADKAEVSEDADTALIAREMQKGFELTCNYFVSETQVVATKSAQPTHTENLPPMDTAKGELRQQPRSRKALQVKPEVEVKPENREETLGSFLKQKRGDARISQWQLGKNGGISPPKISGLENNRQTMNEEELGRLASALSLNDEDKQKLTELYSKQFPQDPQQ